MPSTTPNLGLPYPLDTDHLADWPSTVEDLADALDTELTVKRVARYDGIQTFTSGTPAPVQFTTADGAQSGMTYSAGSFTVTSAGLWRVDASLYIPPASTATERRLFIAVNTDIIHEAYAAPPGTNQLASLTAFCTVQLAVGDVVEAVFEQINQPASSMTTQGGQGKRFDAFRIGV